VTAHMCLHDEPMRAVCPRGAIDSRGSMRSQCALHCAGAHAAVGVGGDRLLGPGAGDRPPGPSLWGRRHQSGLDADAARSTQDVGVDTSGGATSWRQQQQAASSRSSSTSYSQYIRLQSAVCYML
jgi:hypothetical protein